jgi:outer membrane lipoprotein-sorting protein
MDALIDRVRAADPVTPDEFAGLGDFDALVLEPRKRGRKRWLTLPAAGAVVAALIMLPTSAPQASEVLRHATEAMAVPADSILYAKSHAARTQVGGEGADYGDRQVWVYGDKRMRWLDDRNDEAYAEGEGTTRISDGKVERFPGVKMIPNEVFRSSALVEAAKKANGVELTEDGDAYVLRWREKSGPPHWPTIEMTLWVNKDTYAPIKFTDHSWGKDVEGKDFDQTYTETILDFKTLPATAENLKQLELPSQ